MVDYNLLRLLWAQTATLGGSQLSIFTPETMGGSPYEPDLLGCYVCASQGSKGELFGGRDMSNSSNSPNPSGGNLSIAPVTTDSCRPFTLDVMVFSPEAGYKFQVSIERDCFKATADNPAIEQWKLVFDLYKQKPASTDFDQIVHVSYTAANPVQQKKVATTAAVGINPDQSQQLITKVHPAVKGVEDLGSLPPDQADAVKQKVKDQMSKTVDLAF